VEKDNSISIPHQRPFDYSANELLDLTLEGLVIKISTDVTMRGEIKVEELHESLAKHREKPLRLERDEFLAILYKLKEDNFVKYGVGYDTNICISFTGLFFVKSGGYNQADLENGKQPKGVTKKNVFSNLGFGRRDFGSSIILFD